MEERERDSNKGERKKIKIIKSKTIVTMYIYMVIVAIMYMFGVIDWLMWIVFEQKCVKLITF